MSYCNKTNYISTHSLLILIYNDYCKLFANEMFMNFIISSVLNTIDDTSSFLIIEPNLEFREIGIDIGSVHLLLSKSHFFKFHLNTFLLLIVSITLLKIDFTGTSFVSGSFVSSFDSCLTSTTSASMILSSSSTPRPHSK